MSEYECKPNPRRYNDVLCRRARDEAGRPAKYFDTHNPLRPGDGCPICRAGLMEETKQGLACSNCGRTAGMIESKMGGEEWNP